MATRSITSSRLPGRGDALHGHLGRRRVPRPRTAATATIEDTTAPTIVSCPDPVLAESDLGHCRPGRVAVDLGTLVAVDDSGTVVVTNDAPAVFPVGQHPRGVDG